MGFGLGGVNLRQFDVNTILTIYKGIRIRIRMKLIFVCLNFIYIFEYAFSL